jgi:hypothetical protein
MTTRIVRRCRVSKATVPEKHGRFPHFGHFFHDKRPFLAISTGFTCRGLFYPCMLHCSRFNGNRSPLPGLPRTRGPEALALAKQAVTSFSDRSGAVNQEYWPFVIKYGNRLASAWPV